MERSEEKDGVFVLSLRPRGFLLDQIGHSPGFL